MKRLCVARTLALPLMLPLLLSAGACQSTPPPPPAPAHEPSAWMVFFDDGSVALKDQQRQTLDQAAKWSGTLFASPAPPYWQLCLVGHSDNVGSDASNLALSRRRSEVVRAYLVERGLPRDRLAVSAAGSARPLVTTPPNTHEAQNRRVELAFHRRQPAEAIEAACNR